MVRGALCRDDGPLVAAQPSGGEFMGEWVVDWAEVCCLLGELAGGDCDCDEVGYGGGEGVCCCGAFDGGYGCVSRFDL